jgi:hypothetical protein
MMICACQNGFSQIPQTPTVQLFLTDNGGHPVADGIYDISVSLYTTETGGTALWTENQSVDVSGGLANITLGETSPLTVPFNNRYYAGIKIGSGTELTPRLTLNPSVYSLAARAVYGSENIFPESGDVGIGTLMPTAKLDIAGNLRIEDVPETESMAYVLVHDSLGNKIVKAMRTESFLHILNELAWEYQWDWPANVYSSDSVGTPGSDLIVRDSGGNIVFKVDADKGESEQTGLEILKKGLEIPDKIRISTSGINVSPPLEFDWDFSDVDKTYGVKIDSTGIKIFNTDRELVTRFNMDGTSYHSGLEQFAGGIEIPLGRAGGKTVINEQEFQKKIQ